jgi:hypothetical protein
MRSNFDNYFCIIRINYIVRLAYKLGSNVDCCRLDCSWRHSYFQLILIILLSTFHIFKSFLTKISILKQRHSGTPTRTTCAHAGDPFVMTREMQREPPWSGSGRLGVSTWLCILCVAGIGGERVDMRRITWKEKWRRMVHVRKRMKVYVIIS